MGYIGVVTLLSMREIVSSARSVTMFSKMEGPDGRTFMLTVDGFAAKKGVTIRILRSCILNQKYNEMRQSRKLVTSKLTKGRCIFTIGINLNELRTSKLVILG